MKEPPTNDQMTFWGLLIYIGIFWMGTLIIRRLETIIELLEAAS